MPGNQLAMMKLRVNQSRYAQGRHQTPLLGMVCDGICRHRHPPRRRGTRP